MDLPSIPCIRFLGYFREHGDFQPQSGTQLISLHAVLTKSISLFSMSNRYSASTVSLHLITISNLKNFWSGSFNFSSSYKYISQIVLSTSAKDIIMHSVAKAKSKRSSLISLLFLHLTSNPHHLISFSPKHILHISTSL